jgi:hypothetical protein
MLEVTYIGFIGFILIGISYISNSKLLLNLTVFFIPFSATSAINFGESEQGSSVQIYMLFSLSWMAYQVFRFLRDYQPYKSITVPRATSLLLSFLLAAFFSLLMPLYINGADTANSTGRYADYELIEFKSSNITQYLYLVSGAFFSICFGLIVSERDFTSILKTYTYSVIFVMLWGLYELFCFYTDTEYMAYIFNNNIHESAKGYTEVLLTATEPVKRIASVTLEPSFLAQVLLALLPFYVYSCLNRAYIFGRKSDLAILLFLLLYIPLTTSSTAVVGLVFVFVLLFYKTYRKNAFFVYYTLGFICLLCLLVYSLSDNIFYNLIIKEKSETSSGIERMSSIVDGWDTFTKYPLLGVGWGTVSSHDLIIKIAANCGLIGLALFIYFVYFLLKRLNFKGQLDSTHPFYKSTSLSLSVILFCNIISGFSFYLGHLWFILGLSLALAKHKYQPL